MILIIGNENLYKNHSPFDEIFGHKTNGRQSTKEEMEALGLFVDYIPEPEVKEGFSAELRVDLSVERKIISTYEEQAKRDLAWNRENCLYYEYTEIPKGQEDVYTKVEMLEKLTADLTKEIAKKDLQLMMLNNDIANLYKLVAEKGVN